jgi:hypothetical protein
MALLHDVKHLKIGSLRKRADEQETRPTGRGAAFGINQVTRVKRSPMVLSMSVLPTCTFVERRYPTI